MNKLIQSSLALLFFCISLSSQWVQISSIGNNNLKSIKFFDAFTGLAGGNNGIWKSSNSGVNWQQVFSGQNINSMTFTDNNTGYAVCDTGRIYKTTNKGTDWLSQSSTTVMNLYSISFYNGNTGYCVGQGGIIIRTTNSGSSWYSNNNPLTQDLNAVLMLNNGSTAFAVGSNSTEIFTSTANGGTNWIYSLMIPNNSLYSFCNIPTVTGNFIAVGGSGRIRRTTNNGGSWTLITSGSTQTLNDISFINASLGYIVGSLGTILKTTNGGSNWSIENSTTTQTLESMSFIDANTGWIVGNSGIVLRTGIPVGIQSISSINTFQLHQNYPNPFNPKTVIGYELANNEKVLLEIFSINGKLLQKIDIGFKTIGYYSQELDLSHYASGIYIYKLITSSQVQSRKMMLIK